MGFQLLRLVSLKLPRPRRDAIGVGGLGVPALAAFSASESYACICVWTLPCERRHAGQTNHVRMMLN